MQNVLKLWGLMCPSLSFWLGDNRITFTSHGWITYIFVHPLFLWISCFWSFHQQNFWDTELLDCKISVASINPSVDLSSTNFCGENTPEGGCCAPPPNKKNRTTKPDGSFNQLKLGKYIVGGCFLMIFVDLFLASMYHRWHLLTKTSHHQFLWILYPHPARLPSRTF